jgi:hypothetical protein
MPDGSMGVSVPMPSDNAGRVLISDDLKARGCCRRSQPPAKARRQRSPTRPGSPATRSRSSPAMRRGRRANTDLDITRVQPGATGMQSTLHRRARPYVHPVRHTYTTIQAGRAMRVMGRRRWRFDRLREAVADRYRVPTIIAQSWIMDALCTPRVRAMLDCHGHLWLAEPYPSRPVRPSDRPQTPAIGEFEAWPRRAGGR